MMGVEEGEKDKSRRGGLAVSKFVTHWWTYLDGLLKFHEGRRVTEEEFSPHLPLIPSRREMTIFSAPDFF